MPISTQWWPWTKLQPAVRPRSTVSQNLCGRPCHRWRWLLCKATKEASVGKWSRSCSQPLRRPSCATCEMSDAGRAPPPSCGHQLLQSYAHRPPGSFCAGAAQRPFAAGCRSTGICSIDRDAFAKGRPFPPAPSSEKLAVAAISAATSKTRPPPTKLRGSAQQRRWDRLAPG